MEAKTNRYQTSPTYRLARALLFVFAGLTWISAILYLTLARENINLPINSKIFAFLSLSILLFLIPALAYAIPKDPLSPRRILVVLWMIVTSLFWIFAPLYEHLALYIPARAGKILLMNNYIWEVPVAGSIFIFALYYYFLAIMRNFQKIDEKQARIARVRKQLLFFPLICGLGFILISFVGAITGLIIAFVQINAPFSEITKGFVNVMTLGLLGAIFMFFILGEIVQPWLKKLPSPKNS
ncbi:hypothetical protein A3B21_00930 [Candidatus Uhrbacteria bacterium RIFCSPLOWO2_01_FULL_47_24]|uniref:Uncharacterized protein n=1 Tax=Candidatus Uhrbacteria bacterium RIFCSPLOWO2_01_FULL_47_24 TaxID=1802401 RepID=A0A1F7UQK5_9BACT|nr:MAG: hypothetical protein A3D58_01095 [Candidatus Uhrbacteria bacterium RIFCSPHIGHO2_02_FULL_46_47]OGL76633.1 MAG: hypothetical protein A3F52_03615 [Candidatus Uhrbacteria bacterium RIFCSPHIGHO2_12_FULL_47_11]OGL79957.1 MAG: hypothetical protein A3B21_00930 [Candidatus Uhrbacteria bacterium RIFCSPLOWO2_01_FULL_47_24]OGL84337.1 MAG: hypothetical protein A3J03_00400 [Candidatus Uhrbacteria bacterium RIFCSPLOWO2_02_FULL_46_25]OGL91995.1 MAG: hypothetical protein A3H11_01545 [Candidatus Uhrbacte